MLPDAVAEVRAELCRADTKASTMLTLAGLALTIELTVMSRAPRTAPVLVCAALTVGATTAAVVLLALVVRPQLHGRWGMTRYATMRPADLVAEAAARSVEAEAICQAEQLAWSARAAIVKFRRIRLAVDLLILAVAAALATTVLITL